MKNNLTSFHPCFAVNYRLEKNTRSVIDTDIRMMTGLGVGLVRLSVFDAIAVADSDDEGLSLLLYAVRRFDRDAINVIICFHGIIPDSEIISKCIISLSGFGSISGWELPLSCSVDMSEKIARHSAAPVSFSDADEGNAFFSDMSGKNISSHSFFGGFPSLFYRADCLRSLRPDFFTLPIIGGEGGYCPEGEITAEILIPLLAGAAASVYGAWREPADSAGVFGALTAADFRPSVYAAEAAAAAKLAETAGSFLSHTSVLTETAVFTACGKEKEASAFTEAIRACGLYPDILTDALSLDRYSLIFTPYRASFTSEELTALSLWAERGGVWVAGPQSDILSAEGLRSSRSAFTRLERYTGAFVCYELSDPRGYTMSAMKDGTVFSRGGELALFDPGEGDLAVVKEGGSHITGKSVARRTAYGKGCIVLLGATPTQEGLKSVINMAAAAARLIPITVKGCVAVIPRSGALDSGMPLEGLAAIEYGGEDGGFICPRPAVELISGQMLTGNIRLKPYQSVILKYTE